MLSPFKAGNADSMPADAEAADIAGENGWRREARTPSLAEVFGTIRTRPTGPTWRKLIAFLGPGYLVAVGYMDPGNWATSLAGPYSDGEAGALDSPLIDLGAVPGAWHELSWWQFIETEAHFDIASVEGSRDGGSTWELLAGGFDGAVTDSWEGVDRGLFEELRQLRRAKAEAQPTEEVVPEEIESSEVIDADAIDVQAVKSEATS